MSMTGACARVWSRCRESFERRRSRWALRSWGPVDRGEGNMTDLLQEIEAQISDAKGTAGKQNVGIIREVGDGVAKVEGLTDAMLNEMLDLGHGITGLALDLDEAEVGVVVLGDYMQLEEGDEVCTTGKLLQVPVGKGLLGR